MPAGAALVEAVGVALVLADGVALARGFDVVEEKPPRPILIESAAIAISAIRTPIVPRLNVGLGSTLVSTFGPLGRLVLPPLRCTGGLADNV